MKEANKTDNLLTETKNNNEGLTFQKAGLFATYKTQEELQDYFKQFNGNEQFLVQLGSNLTWNWFVHILKDYTITPKK